MLKRRLITIVIFLLLGAVLTVAMAWLVGPLPESSQAIVSSDDPVFPLRPIWIGFVVNVLFYAAVSWLLVRLLAGLWRATTVNRIARDSG